MPEQDRTLELIRSAATTTGLIIATGYLITAAFNKNSRDSIHARADECSEITGNDSRPLEASHINHRRSYQGYNWPENGVLMTDEEHMIYHQTFVGTASAIGLSERRNNEAIGALEQRVGQHNAENGITDLSPEARTSLARKIMTVVSKICRQTDQNNPYTLRQKIIDKNNAKHAKARQKSRRKATRGYAAAGD